MFMAFGGFFCLYSVYNYNIGTAFRMGPGYFPMLLGGFLFFLGFLITAKPFFLKALRKTAASSESLTGTTFL